LNDENNLPEHVRRNRAHWDALASGYVSPGERAWARNEPAWGIWQIPEATLRMLPENIAGKDAIELGCGTAYVSSWLARRGARVVGIDNSAAQLDTARRLQIQHGVEFDLIHGNAEGVPYPDASFDFGISEYGASLWADPYVWIPEAARLLRPGGALIFLVHSPLLTLCMPEQDGLPATEHLQRPAFGMHRVEWPGDDSVEFHLSHGDWLRLLRRNGFEVEDLIEVQVPPDAKTSYTFVTAEWAHQWPSEEVWKARRRRDTIGMKETQ